MGLTLAGTVLVVAATAAISVMATLAVVDTGAPAEPAVDARPSADPNPGVATALTGQITIGQLTPLTGDISYMGTQTDAASELAVEDFNRYLEERGERWRLNMLTEDTATNPVQALEKVQALHSRDVSIVNGPLTSSNIRNIKGYTEANDMLIFGCCSTAPSLAVPGDSIFRLVPNERTQMGIAARVAVSDGIEALIPVWRGDAWGDGLEAAIRYHFAELGGEVDEGIRYNPESAEMSASASLLADKVEALSAEHGADRVAVLLASFESDGLQLIQAASQHENTSSVRWYGTDGSALSEAIVGDEIAGAFVNKVGFLSSLPAIPDNEQSADLKARLSERIGSDPIVYAYSAYDVVWLLGLSILEAGSGDAQAVRAVLPSVAEGHSGAIGSTALNAAGDLAGGNIAFWNVVDGKWRLSVVYDQATDKITSVASRDPGGVSDISGEITIGQLTPLTGDISYMGTQTDAASELAVEDFNRYLEERGEQWTLNMLTEDTATNPVQALEKLQALYSRDVGIVSGPLTSSNIRNIKGYAEANDMIIFGCCSTAPSLAVPGDNVFRLVPNERTQMGVAARLAVSDGIEALIPVWRGDAWGDGLEAAIREHFTSLGGTVDDGIRYNPESAEFSVSASLLSDRIAELSAERGPEKVAVLLASFESDGLQLIQAADQHENTSSVRWYGTDGSALSEAIVGDEIAGAFVNKVGFLSSLPSIPDNEKSDSLKSRLSESLGIDPIVYAYTAYDVVWLLGLSILEAGGDDPNAVKAALPSVAENYSGAIGSTALNNAGDLAGGDIAFWGVEDGKWVTAATYDQATDTIIRSGSPSGITGQITIGQLTPLTGDISYMGTQTDAASELAVEDFNRYLEERGEQWTLNMLTEDTATNPVQALEKLQALYSRDVGIVSGPLTSSNIRNIKGYAEANDMLIFGCCSTAPSLAVPGDNVFRLVPNERTQMGVAARLAVSDGIEALIPVWRGDAWGDGLEAAIREHFTSLGGTVDDGIRYNPESAEFSVSASLLSDRIAELSAERGPEKVAVLLASFESDGLQLIQAASQHENTSSVRWYGTDGSALSEAIAGDEIAGAFVNEVGFVSSLPAIPDNEKSDSLKARLSDELGIDPIVYAYTAYDVVWLLGLSILEAGGDDPGAVKAALPSVAENYSGAIGGTALNDAGDLAGGNIAFWGVEDGKWKLSATYDRAADAISAAG